MWTVQGDPATRLALLRRLVDLDLTGSVRLSGVGVDDPLLLWAGGPRSVDSVATVDSLWVRLVDLPEALTDRAWSAPCDVVVEVVDRSAPWNDGTLAPARRCRIRRGRAHRCRGRPAALDRGTRRCLPRRGEPARPRPCRPGGRAAPRRGPRPVAGAAHRRRADGRGRVLTPVGVLRVGAANRIRQKGSGKGWPADLRQAPRAGSRPGRTTAGAAPGPGRRSGGTTAAHPRAGRRAAGGARRRRDGRRAGRRGGGRGLSSAAAH